MRFQCVVRFICLATSLSIQGIANSQNVDPGMSNAVNPTSEKTSVTMIPLKYCDANIAVNVISSILGNASPEFRMAADMRTNTIVISATDATKKKIMDLLKGIDSPNTNPPSNEEHRVLPLPPSLLDKKSDLLAALAKQCNLMISIAPEMGAVIVKGERQNITQLKELIGEIESTSKQHSDQSEHFILRVMVLASNNTESRRGSPIDASLEEVIQRLDKLGIKNAQIVDQFIMRSSVGKRSSHFQIEGHMMLASGNHQIAIEGDMVKSPESATRVDSSIRIHLLPNQKENSQKAINVGVDVQLVPNRWLVLASSPIKSDTQTIQLVYLVQLIRDE